MRGTATRSFRRQKRTGRQLWNEARHETMLVAASRILSKMAAHHAGKGRGRKTTQQMEVHIMALQDQLNDSQFGLVVDKYWAVLTAVQDSLEGASDVPVRQRRIGFAAYQQLHVRIAVALMDSTDEAEDDLTDEAVARADFERDTQRGSGSVDGLLSFQQLGESLIELACEWGEEILHEETERLGWSIAQAGDVIGALPQASLYLGILSDLYNSIVVEGHGFKPIDDIETGSVVENHARARSRTFIATHSPQVSPLKVEVVGIGQGSREGKGGGEDDGVQLHGQVGAADASSIGAGAAAGGDGAAAVGTGSDGDDDAGGDGGSGSSSETSNGSNNKRREGYDMVDGHSASDRGLDLQEHALKAHVQHRGRPDLSNVSRRVCSRQLGADLDRKTEPLPLEKVHEHPWLQQASTRSAVRERSENSGCDSSSSRPFLKKGLGHHGPSKPFRTASPRTRSSSFVRSPDGDGKGRGRRVLGQDDRPEFSLAGGSPYDHVMRCVVVITSQCVGS